MVRAMRGCCLFAVVIGLVACGAPERRDGFPDAAGPGADGDPGPTGDGDATQTFVYAHTASTLYRVDPDTLAITMVGPFGWSNGGDSMTDIAIDKTGQMIGISMSAVYRVDVTTAAATRLSGNLTGGFNGLSFIPADLIGQTGDDVLVATRNSDGDVFRIDPMTGGATKIGDMGGSYSSSGDLVGVKDFGIAQTVDLGIGNDGLVKLAPQTFAANAVGSQIGFDTIWGIAYWKDKIFGFTDSGQFVTIDPTTGVGTLVQGNGPAWWGAAVTTLAPVIF